MCQHAMHLEQVVVSNEDAGMKYIRSSDIRADTSVVGVIARFQRAGVTLHNAIIFRGVVFSCDPILHTSPPCNRTQVINIW